MAKALGILKRVDKGAGYNLLSFEELKVTPEGIDPIDLAVKKRDAVSKADRWRGVFGEGDIMVSLIDADKCRNVNNHDGFLDAKPAF